MLLPKEDLLKESKCLAGLNGSRNNNQMVRNKISTSSCWKAGEKNKDLQDCWNKQSGNGCVYQWRNKWTKNSCFVTADLHVLCIHLVLACFVFWADLHPLPHKGFSESLHSQSQLKARRTNVSCAADPSPSPGASGPGKATSPAEPQLLQGYLHITALPRKEPSSPPSVWNRQNS